MRPVLIVGASRGVGRLMCQRLIQDNRRVVALIRAQHPVEQLERLGIEVLQGDVMNTTDVRDALGVLGRQGQVVSTVSGRLPNGDFTDDIGNRQLMDQCKHFAIDRFLLVTAIGCGDMLPYRSSAAIAAFGPVVEAKTRAEDYLRLSQLPFTIVRPGGLRDDPESGQGLLCSDPEVHGFINRADLVQLLIQILDSPETLNQTYAAVDRDQMRCVNTIEPVVLSAKPADHKL